MAVAERWHASGVNTDKRQLAYAFPAIAARSGQLQADEFKHAREGPKCNERGSEPPWIDVTHTGTVPVRADS